MRLGFALLFGLLAVDTAWAQAAPAESERRPPAGSWQVLLAVGEVNWRSLPAAAGDDPWHPLRAGATLSPPAEIETASRARVELWRGEDRIQAGPDTRLTLEDTPGDLPSLIRQAAGTVWYSVKAVAGRKFEVESRYLVATVKGTEFRIVLGSQGDLLAVTEGVVRATPRGVGEGLDVMAGQSVLANASGLLLLLPPPGGDPAPRTPAPPERAPASPPSPPAPQESPSHTGRTGDVHGVNREEQHNHGGQKGAGVRDSHGDPKSENGGGAKAKGPK